MGDTNGWTGPLATKVRVLQSAGLVIALVIASAPLSLEKAVGQDASLCETAEFTSSDGPTLIPDNGTAELTLIVPQGSPIQDVDVHVDIAHPFDSDLRLKLVSPSGRRVLLAEAVGTWGDDFAATTFDDQAETSIVSSLPPFTGQYRPVDALAAFAGTPSGGTWKLKVTDLRARYTGTIEAWRLTLVTCADPTVTRKRAGAPDPPPLPEGVPAGPEPVEGRLITVTTNSDASDGDVSTVDTLETNPGSDGISLREAIQATNNDPGDYTVRFDSSLAGASVELSMELPVLRGGGVFIDGDIDGDGRPDVALVPSSPDLTWGLHVVSGGNRLHALALRGFQDGVVLTPMASDPSGAPLWEAPPLTQQTFAHNVVSGLVLGDIGRIGISFNPTQWRFSCAEGTGCRTDSRWLDTRFVGNTIESDWLGIDLGWGWDSGALLSRVTVAGNDIHINRSDLDGAGVNLKVGRPGTSDDRIEDALVAYNAMDVRGTGYGVDVIAGQGGRSGNVVEDLGIVGNWVRFSDTPPGNPYTVAVELGVSDGCWSGHRCQNLVTRVGVIGNVLEGQQVGVTVGDTCCGGELRSRIADVRIASNVINGVILSADKDPSGFPLPWGVVISGYATGVTDVSVDSNTIAQTTNDASGTDRAYLAAGGIAILGGLGSYQTYVRDVAVTRNRVDTKLMGIVVMGGGGFFHGGSEDNRVSDLRLRRNVITRVPKLVTRFDSRFKGISVIGGLVPPRWRPRDTKAVDNTVKCVRVRKNKVAGKRNDIAVLRNVGTRAARNVVRLRRC